MAWGREAADGAERGGVARGEQRTETGNGINKAGVSVGIGGVEEESGEACAFQGLGVDNGLRGFQIGMRLTELFDIGDRARPEAVDLGEQWQGQIAELPLDVRALAWGICFPLTPSPLSISRPQKTPP